MKICVLCILLVNLFASLPLKSFIYWLVIQTWNDACEATLQRYWALVIGCPKEKQGIISASLSKVFPFVFWFYFLIYKKKMDFYAGSSTHGFTCKGPVSLRPLITDSRTFYDVPVIRCNWNFLAFHLVGASQWWKSRENHFGSPFRRQCFSRSSNWVSSAWTNY